MLTRMLDRALHNRELATNARRDVRAGTYDREKQREKARAKPKRRASPYAKRYGKAFKKVMKKYRKKDGSWKKDGFKRAQKAAHKEAKQGSTKKGQVRKTARRAYER